MIPLDPARLKLNDPPSIIWLRVRDAYSLLWEANPKAHDIGTVMHSIADHGFQELPKFDAAIGIKAGNGRVEALYLMEQEGWGLPRGLGLTANGEWAVPILAGTDAETKAKAAAYALDSNNLVLLGGDFSMADILRLYNAPAYMAVVADLAAADEFPVSVPAEDIEDLLATYDRLYGVPDEEHDPPAATDADDAPAKLDEASALREKWGVEPGQLWAIGPHRLGVGDATDSDFVARLLACADLPLPPGLMITDPPYGVEYTPAWRGRIDSSEARPTNSVGRTATVANDDRADWEAAYALFPGDIVYLWHASLYADIFIQGLERAGFQRRAQIIWKKQQAIIGRGHYHWQHEACWYAVRRGATANWQGGYDQSTVWEIVNVNDGGSPSARQDDSRTPVSVQKPVECMLRPIRNHTRPGEAVYDPFAGSGSTLIAAELSGRVAIVGDLLPEMIAVILERYVTRFGPAAGGQPVLLE